VGENISIWLSRVRASPETFFTTGKFGVVVKLLASQPLNDSDRGPSPVGPKIFLIKKKNVFFF